MTIDVDNPRRLEYIGNGSEIDYAYNYRIFEDTDLNVIVDKIFQIVNADYVVSGVNDQGGGNVTFMIAPPDQSEIIIDSDVPALQTVDFEVGGKFKPDTVNFVNDKLTVIDQQTKTLIEKRGLLYPETSFLDQDGKDNALPVLPVKVGQDIPIWSKDANNNIIAVTLEENADCSALRSELASQTEPSPGTGLIGYFDEFDPDAPVGKTLDELLKQIAPLIDSRIAAVNADDTTKRMRFDLSDVSPDTTVVLKIHDDPFGGIPTGGGMIWFDNTPPSGFLECNGQDVDLKSDIAPAYAQDLFNAIGTRWGRGFSTYTSDSAPGAVGTFTFSSLGAPSDPPDAGSTGFTINVTVPGNVNTYEQVEITFVAGNVIPAGSFFKLFDNFGRSNIFWYSVDGAGTAPAAGTDLIAEVAILSTDTAAIVNDKTRAEDVTQFRVPDCRSMFLRGFSSSSSEDPLRYLKEADISNAGTGYLVNDILTLDSNSVSPASVKVEAVGGSGEVQIISINSRGRYEKDFPPSSPNNPTGGAGTGAELTVNSPLFDPGLEAGPDERKVWSSTQSSMGGTDQNIGASTGTYQFYSFQSHQHPLTDIPPNVAGTAFTTGSGNQPVFPGSGQNSTELEGGIETRPFNISVMFVIKT